MQAVITVLSGMQWQQDKYRKHEGFQAHVRDADVLVINRYAQLSSSEKHTLQQWIAKLNSQVDIIWAVSEQIPSDTTKTSNAYLAALNTQLSVPSHILAQQRTVNISRPQRSSVSLQPLNTALSPTSLLNPAQANDDAETSSDLEQPYRYHEKQQDLQLAGWRLPAHYLLKADDLQNWLLTLPNWQRIKGVVHTSDGWLQINFTPDSLTTSTISPQVDSRLEVILQLDDSDNHASNTALENEGIENTLTSSTLPELSPSIDWEACDRELMALVI
jgi:G3E family GTPase